ncbi:MAG: peptidyl-prolyl cis-trans isomerase [Candidatus Dadabacteria bacterium]|nr:MAG: peptidyl-prolyl cis-trans isomerase [Candidatus Dadabacteria bacterium]
MMVPRSVSAVPEQDRPGLWLGLALVGLLIAALGTVRGPTTTNAERPGPSRSAVVDGDVIAWVNGVPIRKSTLQAWQAAAARERGQQSSDALLQAVIDQELLYQEGVRQGLLQSDPVIRRRVIQLIAEQIGAAVGEPTNEDLVRFYAAHQTWYTRPAQIRFAQLFVPADRVSPESVTASLRGVHEGMALDAFLEVTRKSTDRLRAHDDDLYYAGDRLAALYGPDFASRLLSLPVGQVAGPLRSSLGWHMVAVLEKLPEQRRPLEQVRNIVARDWRQNRQAEVVRNWLEQARARADIEILQEPRQ